MILNSRLKTFYPNISGYKFPLISLALKLSLENQSNNFDMNFANTLAYAKELDGKDFLKEYRNKFYIPLVNGKECIYFNGNSLGLQPKTTQDHIINELEDWANYAGEGHFHAKTPWVNYHDIFPEKISKIIGCLPEEISVMNQLTINLHLLLATFYRPTKKRYKIICEAKAFPSDQYALESQVKLHGFSPEESIIEISPAENEYVITTENILNTIDQHADEVALVIFGGINYYTGQVFDMQAISRAAHKVGACCGFDLAHAAGNISLRLHDWNVDFACWCSYKYLNSGPGGIAGAFIHHRHINNPELPRLAGWWGYDKASRFKMDKGFKPIPTAEGWQVSCTQVLNMAAHRAAIDIFDAAGMDNIISKSKLITGYLIFVLKEINNASSEKKIEIITPENENERGSQVSMLMLNSGKEIFNSLKKEGVFADWREPNVIRVAPVPLYNSFEDVYNFGDILRKLLIK